MSTITLNGDSTSTIINTDDIRFNIVSINELSDVDTTGLAVDVLLKYNNSTGNFEVTDEIDGGTY